MTQVQLQLLADQVAVWVAANGRQFDATHFAKLINDLQDRLDHDMAALPAAEIWVAAAMCLLGPARAGPPPALMHLDLTAITGAACAAGPLTESRVLEIVAAYGCGKVPWRTVMPGVDTWEARWAGAMKAMTAWIKRTILHIDQRLRAFPVPGYVQARLDSNWAVHEATALTQWICVPDRQTSSQRLKSAEQLTVTCDGPYTVIRFPALAAPIEVPHGAKYVFTVSDAVQLSRPSGQCVLPANSRVVVNAEWERTTVTTISPNGQRRLTRLGNRESMTLLGPTKLTVFTCACGSQRCADRHSLEGWDPSRVVPGPEDELPLTLASFLASAVKGPRVNLTTNSFKESIYFSFLSWIGLGNDRLRAADVAVPAPSGGFSLKKHLVLTHTVRPVEMCKCRCCKQTLFEYPSVARLRLANSCHCGGESLTEPQLRRLWRRTGNLLLKGRRIDTEQFKRRQRGDVCPACGRLVKMYVWCPTCRGAGKCVRTLPMQATLVWVHN